MSLALQSEPPQSFSAGFELEGAATAGRLTLTSPLGSTLAQVRWTETAAEMEANQQVRRFASMDELMLQLTGTAVPVGALFQWLAGQDAPAPGWQADLSRVSDGRITAQRLSPLPLAQLRVVLDR